MVAGVAGALDAGLPPEDVTVGTESVEHDYKPRFGGVWPPPQHPAAPAAVGPVGFRPHRGPIASGDEDIVDAAHAWTLADATGALCVAWEGAGGSLQRATFHRSPGGDRCPDAFAVGSYRANLPAAVGNVGRVLLAWLSR